MLSTGFTLPYALVQPVLGALADMFSKTRLIAICMLILGIATLACGLATNFETLMGLRVLAGITAGGIFPIAFAVAGDRVPVAQRQVAIGKLLFRGHERQSAGRVGRRRDRRPDRLARRVLCHRRHRPDRACGRDPRLPRHGRSAGRFDLSTLVPNYRAIFRNPLAKYCFGAVFLEAVFMFGVFPYMAGAAAAEGETRASIAGIVIAGFGIGGVIYTLNVSRLLTYIGEQRLMAAGGMVMGLFCLIVIALRAPWPVEFVNFMLLGFGFYMLHGCIQVYVTELAPAARGSAMAGHSVFFFLGQAIGPVVYGIGLGSVGIVPVLLVGAVVLTATGWICALRRPEAA